MPDGSPFPPAPLSPMMSNIDPAGLPPGGSSLETLVKMVHTLGAVRDADHALKLAGSNARVKAVEESIDDCLRGCANVPKLAAEQLRKALQSDAG